MLDRIRSMVLLPLVGSGVGKMLMLGLDAMAWNSVLPDVLLEGQFQAWWEALKSPPTMVFEEMLIALMMSGR